MDIKKLKYDVSMQCAVIDILSNHSGELNSPDFDLRTCMLDTFASYYFHFCTLDNSRWELFKTLDEETN